MVAFQLLSEAASFYAAGHYGHKAVKYIHKRQKIKQFKRSAGAFINAPSVATAWNLGGSFVGVVGTERFIGQLVKYAILLEQKVKASDDAAGKEMVDTMRSRVPVDTGRLYNGIEYENDDGEITVTASAINPRGDTEYARFVEFGHETPVADGSFFENGSTAGAALQRRGPTDEEAQPFFWDSAREVLERRRINLDKVATDAGREAGF